MNRLAFLLLVPLIAIAGGEPVVSAAAASGLCGPAETTYFNCQTGSGKAISLCGRLPDRLQYRYGRRGKVELQFPEAAADGPARLTYSHYARPQTDYVEIGFENGGVSYTVFDYTETDARHGGVTVTSASGEEHSIDCAGKLSSRLSQWQGVLRCDPDNALDGGNCH